MYKVVLSQNYYSEVKPNPVLNALLCTRPLTFIIEMLQLVGAACNPTVASTRLLWQAFTMGSVTKATPILFIDSKSCIKKLRGRKTALSGYYECVATHTIFFIILKQLYTPVP